MTAIRTRRYRVSPERFEEFSVRRVAVIEAVRARGIFHAFPARPHAARCEAI